MSHPQAPLSTSCLTGSLPSLQLSSRGCWVPLNRKPAEHLSVLHGKDRMAWHKPKPACPLPAGTQGDSRCSSVGWTTHLSPGTGCTAMVLSSAGTHLTLSKKCCLMRETKPTKANVSPSHCRQSNGISLLH